MRVCIAAGSLCETCFFVFARVFVCVYVFVCFVYDVSCGVVWFVCFCLSLCIWLFGFDMKCLAAGLLNYCAMMCDVVWSVSLFFCVCDLLLALLLLIVFE